MKPFKLITLSATLLISTFQSSRKQLLLWAMRGTFIIAVVAGTIDARGQGSVVFVTSILGSSAKVLEGLGFSGAGQALGNTAAGVAPGTQFLAQLYVGAGNIANSTSLVPVGTPVNFRGGTANSGYVQESGTSTLGIPVDTTVTIPASILPTPGGAATVQLRAWWAGVSGNQYPTFEAAFFSGHPLMRLGGSPLLYLPATGNSQAQPPGIPVSLTGLSGFQFFLPEPSSVSLLLLGGAVVWCVRKKCR